MESLLPAQKSSAPLPLSHTFAWFVVVCVAALVSAPLLIAWIADILLK